MGKFQFKNKVILIISPEKWGDHYVSKHHYAIHLSKENKVFFLNPPSQKFSLTKLEPNLTIIDYSIQFRGLRYLPNILAGYLVKGHIDTLEKKTGTEFDILWNFDPSRFFNFSLLKKKLRICHIVDLNQVYQREILAKTSNICLTTSNDITQALIDHNSNTFKINHGYQQHKESKTSGIDLPGGNSINAVFLGNFSRDNIDWDVLKEATSKNKSVDFIFVGPLSNTNLGKASAPNKNFKQIEKKKNVYFVGPVKSHEIPSVLRKADILIVVFKEFYHSDQSNPHKMMEYLGSGRVIVATKTSEYSHLANAGLIAMTDKNEEFVDTLEKVAVNINQWNSPDKMKKRIQFAQDNTYDKQIQRIEVLIEDLKE